MFFAARTGLNPSIRHGQKRLEHLAGRFLVQHLWPEIEFGEIVIGPNGKPHAPDLSGRAFSISHSFPYVAAIVTHEIPCGIDIQVPKANIAEISPKFLSERENALFRTNDDNLLWIWSAKEAVYKWANTAGLQLLRDIELKYLYPGGEQREATFLIEHPDLKAIIDVKGLLTPEFALAVALQ